MISLDGITIKNLKTAVMDLSIVEQQFKVTGMKVKKKVEMILGYSFFRGRTLTIDYTQNIKH